LTQTPNQAGPEAPLLMQQLGILNLRINDMMAQLNAVIKIMMDENAALKKENAELKAKQEKQVNLEKTVKT
jgi:regulator of replication initiation timing